MNRIDWLILRRVLARIGLVLALFCGLLGLVESMDGWRMTTLTRLGGPQMAALALLIGAVRGAIGALPVAVLIGTILGVLDLQSRREFTVIRASGVSIWRAMRLPVLAVVLLGLLTSFVIQPLALEANRQLPVGASRNADSGTLWIEQRGDDGRYVMQAVHPHADGIVMEDVNFFLAETPQKDRIEAKEARLSGGAWELTGAIRYRPDSPPEALPDAFRLTTTTTRGDMRVTLTSARDLGFFELVGAMGNQLADPGLRAGVLTMLVGFLALPGLLAGAVLIGFAFTSAYRRTNKYGASVLYGIVLGFVLYVVTELANHSGFAGLLDPTFASAGPALVAIVIGLTVLLFREDGRT